MFKDVADIRLNLSTSYHPQQNGLPDILTKSSKQRSVRLAGVRFVELINGIYTVHRADSTDYTNKQVGAVWS